MLRADRKAEGALCPRGRGGSRGGRGLTCSHRLVTERKELVCSQREGGVGTSLVIRKLAFEGVGGEELHHGSCLTPVRAAFRDILGERHHVQDTYCVDHLSDRKSTRLNSSHANISYAVFC